jgi:hypothetical protein
LLNVGPVHRHGSPPWMSVGGGISRRGEAWSARSNRSRRSEDASPSCAISWSRSRPACNTAPLVPWRIISGFFIVRHSPDPQYGNPKFNKAVRALSADEIIEYRDGACPVGGSSTPVTGPVGRWPPSQLWAKNGLMHCSKHIPIRSRAASPFRSSGSASSPPEPLRGLFCWPPCRRSR